MRIRDSKRDDVQIVHDGEDEKKGGRIFRPNARLCHDLILIFWVFVGFERMHFLT
jgi:hypothetical protein